MAEYLTPEYQALIAEIEKRNQQKIAQANAQAQGEAQRRGLVGQTGTSDIEMSLRGARTQPIVEAGQGQVAGLMKEMADQKRQERLIGEERQYSTGEREAMQKYQTGERLSAQDYQNLQNIAQREFQTSERLGSQQYQTGENVAQRGWQTGEREAGQRYGTEERLGQQGWQTGERTGTQDWQSAQNVANRGWQGEQNALDRAFQEQAQHRQRGWQLEDQPSGWQSFLGGITPGIGQGIGSKIASWCFDKNTPITMEDGTIKKISELQLGDKTLGGEVQSLRISKTPDKTRYNYLGVIVTGSHAVKEHDKWVRVEKSDFGIPIKGEGVVYSISTSNHRIYINNIEFCDEAETDYYEYLSIDESLDMLNGEVRKVR